MRSVSGYTLCLLLLLATGWWTGCGTGGTPGYPVLASPPIEEWEHPNKPRSAFWQDWETCVEEEEEEAEARGELHAPWSEVRTCLRYMGWRRK